MQMFFVQNSFLVIFYNKIWIAFCTNWSLGEQYMDCLMSELVANDQ